MSYLGLALLGYLLGSCPWGYWLVRLVKREDIRRIGSGNIGAANVFRTYGASLGLPVTFLDFAKGLLPALAGVAVEGHVGGIVAGAAAMAGHWRPIFLRFARGGKLVATGGGVFFAVAPLVALTGLAIWLVVFAVTGISSIASLLTTLWIPIGSWLYGLPRVVTAFSAAAFLVVLWLHRANLQRLRHGTEAQSRIALWRRIRPARG